MTAGKILLALFAVFCPVRLVVAVTVTTFFDENDTPAGANVSLREAIRDTPPGGTVDFAAGMNGFPCFLNSELVIGKNLKVDATVLPLGFTVSGNSLGRVFRITSNSVVTLQGLTLVDGYVTGGRGGGILVDQSCIVTARWCELRRNYASGFGGGICVSNAAITLERCTLEINTSLTYGGGLQVTGTADLRHCTLSANSASLGGGGISDELADTITIRSCTMTGNASLTEGFGSEIDIIHSTVQIGGSIIDGSVNINGTGTVTSLGYNLAFATQYSNPFTGTGDITNRSPMLRKRAYYQGGRVRTFALEPLSPAYDAGFPTSMVPVGTETDSRDMERVTDGDGDGIPRMDIGAYESQILLVDTPVDENNGIGAGAGTSLREAISNASNGATIRFMPAMNATTVALQAALGPLQLGTNSLRIDASMLTRGVAIDGGSQGFRVMNVNTAGLQAAFVLELSNLQLRRGQSPAARGGGVFMLSSNSTFRAFECEFSNNESGQSGGAFYLGGTYAEFIRSAIIGNRCAIQGGAVATRRQVDFTVCTLASNAAGTGGGALYDESGLGFFSFYNSTASANTSSNGASLIYLNSNGGMTCGSSILEGGIRTGQFSSVYSLGYNIVNNSTVGSRFTGPSDRVDAVNPLLGPPAYNGGTTRTCALQAGSPAINTGDPTTELGGDPLFDQRGLARTAGGRVDVGAYETDAATGDVDGDGLPDWWEILHNFSFDQYDDSENDFDYDQCNSYNEYLARTHPMSDRSLLRATDCSFSGATAQIAWASTPDRTYQILGASTPEGLVTNAFVQAGVVSAALRDDKTTFAFVPVSTSHVFFAVNPLP